MSHKNIFAEEIVLRNLPSPVSHSAANYGYNIDGNGRGVKISIIDTGRPDHLALKSSANSINFSQSQSEVDTIGQSTIVSGIIGANEPTLMTGMAQGAELYYAKICNDDGKVGIDAVVSGFLWSIIKGVDIIIMPMTLDNSHEIFKDTVEKATNSNICVICSAGFHGYEQFPASYSGVMSVGATNQKGERAGFSALGKVNAVGTSICSTYVNQHFCIARGSAIATAVVGGLAAVVAGNLKAKGQINPIEVYSQVEALTKGN